jgi:hypothetical protein
VKAKALGPMSSALVLSPAPRRTSQTKLGRRRVVVLMALAMILSRQVD